MIIATALMWLGLVLGLLGISGGIFLVLAWAHDKYRRHKARHARGYEIPDPQAKPAAKFKLPVDSRASVEAHALRVQQLIKSHITDPVRKPRLHS